MSKINVIVELKSQEGKHIFKGKGIKNKDVIIYNDDNILTKIKIKDTVFLERKKDYHLKLGFNINEKVKGTYITKEGKLDVLTETKILKIEKNSIKIKYNLMINNVFIDNFEFNLKYTIDTK